VLYIFMSVVNRYCLLL